MFKSILVAALLVSGLASNAIASQNDPALEIQSVSVVEVETPSFAMEMDTQVELPVGNPIGEISIMIDSLIAIGKKVWPIVQAGQPVLTNRLIPATSILPHLDNPRGVMDQMANWSIPKSSSYRISFRNGFNSEVIGFTYTIYFQYNGSLNGVGKYVTNLRVQASEIYASWGFNFDAVSELVGISNVGSTLNPVASGIMQVSYVAKGVLNEVRHAQSFYVDGNGNIKALNN